MFVQVIQGKAKDPDALKERWQSWAKELKPQAEGYLGSTAGVADDGTFIAVARFESEEAARNNSGKPEQDKWWSETQQYIEGTEFHDSTDVTPMLGGGSDDAGFVQIMQGRVTDVEAVRELMAKMTESMSVRRPDVIGGITAGYDDGAYTQVIYFTSEAEARKYEKQTSDEPPSEEMKQMMALVDGPTTFIDLTDPWFDSK